MESACFRRNLKRQEMLLCSIFRYSLEDKHTGMRIFVHKLGRKSERLQENDEKQMKATLQRANFQVEEKVHFLLLFFANIFLADIFHDNKLGSVTHTLKTNNKSNT